MGCMASHIGLEQGSVTGSREANCQKSDMLRGNAVLWLWMQPAVAAP